MNRAAEITSWLLLSLATSVAVYGGEGTTTATTLKLTVVFNNVPQVAGLETGWGFACVVEASGRKVLFDTGGNGDVLLANMERLGIDPGTVEAVVLSHDHHDHTGGLSAFLERNPRVTVYIPESFPGAFRVALERRGASVETVSGPRRLVDALHSSGELGVTTPEQALIIDTGQGLVVITGCAHPDIVEMSQVAREYLRKDILLLMGGFHLGGKNGNELQAIIAELKRLGVSKIAPSHCTGDAAIAAFRQVWGDAFVEGGLGAVIEVPE